MTFVFSCVSVTPQDYYNFGTNQISAQSSTVFIIKSDLCRKYLDLLFVTIRLLFWCIHLRLLHCDLTFVKVKLCDWFIRC